ncbi:hypothetical protein FRC07_004954, partial [Ceratobasidium sp. 392]
MTVRPNVSKPLPPIMPSPPASYSGRDSPVSMRSFKSTSSANSTAPLVVARGCGGPSSVAGPSRCNGPCIVPAPRKDASPRRPPRPEDVVDQDAVVYEEPAKEDQPASLPSISSSPTTKLRLARVSTATHLSISSSLGLPFSSKRRPSIPIEDFPSSPTDDEWEDFSFEEDIKPIPSSAFPISPTSPTSPAARRNTLRRKSSAAASPRIAKGASLARSYASRRSRKSRFTAMNARTPTSAVTNFVQYPSVYSTYSYYDPAQLDAALDDQSDVEPDMESAGPSTPLPPLPPKQETTDSEVSELGEVPGGANLDPRGSVSSVSTVRPPIGQRSQSRLGGLRDKFRWRPGRSASGQGSSSDEHTHGRTSSDSSSIDTFDAACPLYNRVKNASQAATTSGKSVVFTKPGFRSFRNAKPSSPDFQREHGYKSSTDSSSYAASISSFEQNVRLGGTSASYSSCSDSFEGSPRSKTRPLSPSRTSIEEPKSVNNPPAAPTHVRSRSHNYHYPRPRTVKSFESLRQPGLRNKNDVPHHPFQPSA